MINSTPLPTQQQILSIQEWRRRYQDLGLLTIPLVGKQPFASGSWKETPVDIQWQDVDSNFDGNIGIVTGRGLAVIDADDHGTATSIENALKGMGLNPLVVQTPRGRHFYQRVDGMPDWFNVSILLPDVYKGELRGQNSYVVAPCSRVNGISYQWEEQFPEVLLSQRAIDWQDLSWLIPTKQAPNEEAIQVPIRLLRREMPGKAKALLQELYCASKGQNIEKYASRSHAEAAVISMMILAGWQYDEILDTFSNWMPGKFSESKGKDQQRYFDKTYHRVLSKVVNHPIRKEIAGLWQTVSSYSCWPGHNGFNVRDLYLGFLAICWQFGSWQISASERQLAEYIAGSRQSVNTPLKHLIANGLIRRVASNRSSGKATTWNILPLEFVPSQIMTYGNFSRNESPEIAELWSRAMLGKTAGTIYCLLGSKPLRINDLAKQTGKAWSTIQDALYKLKQVELATQVGKQWICGMANIQEVANKFETKKTILRRRMRHQQERVEYQEHRMLRYGSKTRHTTKQIGRRR